MSYRKILNSAFFLPSEDTDSEVHARSYSETRDLIVEYSLRQEHWREIHTGLIIIRTELHALSAEAAVTSAASYARRLLSITEGLIAQIEMAVKSNASLHPLTEDKEVPSDEKPSEKAVFTGKYSDFIEVVFLFLEAGFINGGGRHSRAYIIRELHSLAGLEYDAKKFHNAKNGIERRCPAEGSRVTYFLDDIIDKVNARLSA